MSATIVVTDEARAARIAELKAKRPDAAAITAAVHAAIEPHMPKIQELKAAAALAEEKAEWTIDGSPVDWDYFAFWAIDVIAPAVTAALEGSTIYCSANCGDWQAFNFGCDVLDLRPYNGVSVHDVDGVSMDAAHTLSDIDRVIRELVEDYDAQLEDLINGVKHVDEDDNGF